MNMMELALRFTQAAAHVLWAGAMVALAVFAVERLFVRTAAGRHGLHLAGLILLALSLPVAFVITPVSEKTATGLATTSQLVGGESSPTVGVPVSVNPERPNRPETTEYTAAPLPPASAAKEPVVRWEAVAPWAASGYLAGLLVMLVRMTCGFAATARLRRQSDPVEAGVWTEAMQRMGDRVRISLCPALKWSREVAAPVIAGFVKPAILLPLALASRLSAEQVEAVLAHELAHLRRRDTWALAVQRWVETVLFFHPAVWWMSHQMTVAREEACDDWVLAAGCDPADYAEALVICSECRSEEKGPSPRLSVQLAAAGGNRDLLRRRVLRLIGGGDDGAIRLGRTGWVLGLLLLGGVAMAVLAGNAGRADLEDFDLDNPPGAYEKGIRVADRTQRFNAYGLQFHASPVRWEKEGWLRLPAEQQGPGEELFLNLGVSGGYEIVEVRLFDHATRRLIHDTAWQHPGDDRKDFFVERIGSTNWLRMKEAGGVFPDKLDVWLRIAVASPGKTLILAAEDGASAQSDGSKIVVTSLLEGGMNGKGSGPDGPMIWDLATSRDQDRMTTVNLENRGDLLRGRYHLVAVKKDGSRHPMDHTHFWDFKKMNRHAYFLMDVARSDLDHLELVPFNDRQKFFFNGLAVPPKNASLSKEDPETAVRREHRSRQVATGRAIDSETGATVENFVIQDRLPMSPEYDGPPVFGGETRSDGGFRDGKFPIRASDTYENDELVEEGHGECRLVADGYLPEHVVVPDDHPSGEVFIVRLRRGNMIRGRVLDHAGKPVIGAGIYLSNGQRVIELTEGPHSEFQASIVHTDENGRFEMSGGGADNKAIFVTAPSLFVWRADLPQPGQEAAIRLPEPAKLRIRYDIKGAPTKAQVRIELRTWDMPKWQGAINVERWVDLVAGKDGVLIENLPPGVYDISRIKHLRTATSGTDAMLDRNLELTLESGKTAEYNFVRPAGASISGEIVGLPDENVDGVFVYVKPVEASGDPRERTDWKLPTFDGLSMDGNGEFTTERITPGRYRIIATANRTETPEERFRSGWRLPAWVGSAIVTVPEAGEVPRVRVEMKPYSARAMTTRDDVVDKSIVGQPPQDAEKKMTTTDAAKESERNWGEAIETTPWGEPTEIGLRTRLRLDEHTSTRKSIMLHVDAGNEGEVELQLARMLEGCWLEVDGQWYSHLLVYDGDPPEPIQLKAGAKFYAFETFELDAGENSQWLGGYLRQDGKVPSPSTHEIRPPARPLDLKPGKHTIRLAYTPTPEKAANERGFAYSNPVEIEVVATGIPRGLEFLAHVPEFRELSLEMTRPGPAESNPDPWGEPADGVQVRLHSPRQVWSQGELLVVLQTDLRSETERVFPHYGPPIAEFILELDGHWYETKDRNAAEAASVGPSPALQRLNLHTAITSRHWRSMSTGEPMPDPAPGRHTFRIGFPLSPDPDVTGQRPLAVSNPVEIDIVPRDDSVSITGRVIGVDGKPASAVRVTALPQEWNALWGLMPQTMTGPDGTFSFSGLPDGPCDVSATPAPLTDQPNLRIQGVVLKKGVPVHVTLSLEEKYSYGGRFTDAAGRPQPGRNVLAIWKDPAGRNTYSSDTKTDAEGRYQFRSPFETAERILINDGDFNDPLEHRNVRAGREDVDFRRSARGAPTTQPAGQRSGFDDTVGRSNRPDFNGGTATLVEEASPGPSEFRTVLPSGITVELLGICEDPGEPKQWWRPDGRRLEQGPFARSTCRMSTKGLSYAAKVYGIAYRVTGNSYGYETSWVDQSTGSGRGMMVDASGKNIYPSEMDHTVELLPEELESTSMTFGFPRGQWQVRMKVFREFGGFMETTFQGQRIVLNAPRVEGDQVEVVCSEAFGETGRGFQTEYGLMYTRNDQEAIVSLERFKEDVSDNDQTGMRQHKFTVDCDPKKGLIEASPSEITGVCFRYRPLTFVTFRNVSLRPGVRTDVEITTDEKSSHERTAAATTQGTTSTPASPGQPRFAMYLVLGHTNAPHFRGTDRARILFSEAGNGADRFDAMRPQDYPLDGLILAEQPLLTEADLIAYDRQQNLMRLKAGVIGRFPKPSVWGVPFVVVADGQRLFLGAFWTGYSSYSANVPTISLDRWGQGLPAADPDYLPPDAVRLENRQVLRGGDLPRDPRRDERLVHALQAAGKLVDVRSADEPWGEGVHGVAARLRTERRPRWAEDYATPWVLFDLKNASRDWEVTLNVGGTPTEALVDGVLYQNHERVAGQLPVSKPGQEAVGATLILDKRWQAVKTVSGPPELHLKPGKHEVQAVAYARRLGDPAGQPVRVFSNPIEILPRDDSVSITGRVIGVDGKPASVVRVTALPREWNALWGLMPQTMTGPDGTFSFSGLPDGPCDVSATPAPLTDQPNLRIQGVVLKKGEPVHVTLSLEEKYSYGGRFTDAAGRPQPGRNVLAIWKDPAGKNTYSSDTKTDPAGRYRFQSSFEEAERILIQDGDLNDPLEHGNVRAGREDIDFRTMPKPKVFENPNSRDKGIIRGRIVDPNPTVLSPEYHVMLWRDPWETNTGRPPSLIVGMDEVFEFRAIPPGEYEIRAREWRPRDRVVHWATDWSYVQTETVVVEGQTAEVELVFAGDDAGRWSDAYTWGDAVDGVIMRITQSQFRIAPGEELDLRVDIYNGGQTDRGIALEHEAWELEVNGEWLKPAGGLSGDRSHLPLPAKQARHQIEVWPWLWENMALAIRNLPSGNHTIRVARLLNGEGRSPGEPRQIRVVSQPVTVEVLRTDTIVGTLRSNYGDDPARIAANPDNVGTGRLDSNEVQVHIVPAAADSRLPNGIYRVRPPDSNEKGIEMARGDAEGTVVVLHRLTDHWGSATMASTANDNTKFRVDLKSAGPFSGGDDIGPMALVANGICTLVWGHSGPDSERRMDLSSSIVGKEAGERMADGLGVQPRLRSDPGYKMDVRFTPLKAAFKPGEPVLLKMEIENVGDRPFTFGDGGRQRGARNNQFGFRALRNAGQGAEVPDTGDPNHFGGLMGLRTLHPGSVFEKEVDVAKWFDLSSPDTYQIDARFEMEIFSGGQLAYPCDWDDVARGTTRVTMVGE